MANSTPGVNIVIEFLYEYLGCLVLQEPREPNFLRFMHNGRDCILEFRPMTKMWHIIHHANLEPISESEGLETGELLHHILSIPEDFLVVKKADPQRRLLFNKTMIARLMNEVQEIFRTLGFQIEYAGHHDFTAFDSKIKIRMTLNLWDWYITICDIGGSFEPLFHNDLVCDHWSLTIDYLKKITQS